MDFEQILNTIQPFVIMFAALFAAFLTATWIAVVIWAFRDIRARSRDIFAQILATLMVLIFFPLFPFPGLILYLILRPRETLAEIYERSLEEEALLQGIEERMACPGCNRRIEEEFMICPTCHTRLKKACPTCGRLLHLRWNICPFCGAVQTAAKAIPPLSARPVTMPVEPAAATPALSGGDHSSLPQPEPEMEAGPGPMGEAESPADTGPLAEAPSAADTRPLVEDMAEAEVEDTAEAEVQSEEEGAAEAATDAADEADAEAKVEDTAEAEVEREEESAAEAATDAADEADAEPEGTAQTLPFEFE